jgi:hypothetical protein
MFSSLWTCNHVKSHCEGYEETALAPDDLWWGALTSYMVVGIAIVCKELTMNLENDGS